MLRRSRVLAYRSTDLKSICHPSTMADMIDRPREDEEPGRLGRPFWQLWSASALSNLADGLVKIALPLVAVTLTDSPGLVAGVTLAVTLPWLLFALPVGALADRVDRRIAMVMADVVRAAAMAVLAVPLVLGLESSAAALWVLYAVALLLGTAETVYDTCAQSILPQVVARDRLPRANGRLIAVELTANEFVGPPLGGLLVAAGVAAAFVAPAALWAAAVGALLLLRGGFAVPREEPTTLRADVAEGLRYLWRHRLLRTLAAMTGLFNFATNATFAVFVLYAVGPDSAMGLTEVGYGLLFATLAAGSLIGALLADPIIRRLGRSRSLLVGLLGGVGTVGVAAVTTIPLVIAVAFLIGGLTNALWNVVAVSLRQRITPDRILGRINSSYRLVAWGTRPLGAAAGGLLAELLGLRAVFAVAAALILGTLIGMPQVTDTAISTAEQDADN
ncbi:MAG TPA: MFS transporter [Blastococcus sp.]|nr:MFS transporter [Blastococcus sp.]